MATTRKPNLLAWRVALFCMFLLLTITPVKAAGTYAIVPASGTFVHSCKTTAIVSINVVSGQSNAGDIIITYDTTKIEILDSMPSIPGIQIKQGSAFESFVGNSVNTTSGTIKLIGYSTTSTLTGAADFATIEFKPKPFSTSGGFTFTFTGADPYNTLDSNIADATTSYDMLTSVSNSLYTFTSGSCTTDTTPPTITFISPKNFAQNVPSNATVTFSISDTGAGVDLTTVTAFINGVTYTSSDPGVAVSGSPANYTFSIIPSTPFPANTQSVITVTAKDIAQNARTSSISFNAPPTFCPSYSAPTTSQCTPAPSISPTPTLAPESPSVTISTSQFSLTKQDSTIIVEVTDDTGIAPETFLLQLGGKQYSLQATPELITVTGTKNRYLFTVHIAPDQLKRDTDGAILGFVRITDIDGNTRIENISIASEVKPTPSPSQRVPARISADSIAKAIFSTAALGLVAIVLPLLFVPPFAIAYNSATRRRILFPHAYVISNGKKMSKIGLISGGIIGIAPKVGDTLVVQKYGYREKTIVIPERRAGEKTSPIRIELSRM